MKHIIKVYCFIVIQKSYCQIQTIYCYANNIQAVIHTIYCYTKSILLYKQYTVMHNFIVIQTVYCYTNSILVKKKTLIAYLIHIRQFKCFFLSIVFGLWISIITWKLFYTLNISPNHKKQVGVTNITFYRLLQEILQ